MASVGLGWRHKLQMIKKKPCQNAGDDGRRETHNFFFSVFSFWPGAPICEF
jgi:hypothetical protein